MRTALPLRLRDPVCASGDKGKDGVSGGTDVSGVGIRKPAVSKTQVILPGKRQFQLRPQFPDEQNAERTGEKAQRPEELQSGDDGHEKADRQQPQAVSQKLWLQEFSGEPGNPRGESPEYAEGNIPRRIPAI